MDPVKNVSPIEFPAEPLKTESRDGWEVVISYEGEDQGPFLVDLSHRAKWDFQDYNIDSLKPFGLSLPPNPGECLLDKGLLINRMNNTQASIWSLAGEAPTPPQELAWTELTSGLALVAVVGQEALSVMEKVSRLDLAANGRKPPFLVQGPVLGIPCQVVVLGQAGQTGAVLVAFSRGYGQAVAEAFLESCQELGLKPGGEGVFSRWLES
ncbi:MAG: sarcosine oxidase subunit gamma SoxG [Deltaproteobacteria bacterium]|nr:sarcosine oxidase subunit gamma SoxG [Deltaproteobacteria bacterium]